MAKKHTFVIEVLDTQSQSWQGNIQWVEEQKTESFRSALELIKLMDSAINDENTEK